MALAAILPLQKHKEEAKVTVAASSAALLQSSSKPVNGTTPIDLRKVRESTSPQGDIIKETGNLSNAQVPVMFKTWMKFSFDPTLVYETKVDPATGKEKLVMKELDEDDFKALVRDIDWSSSSGASSSNLPQAITSKEFGNSMIYFFKFMGPELIKEFAKDTANPLARGKRVAVTVVGLGTGFVEAATGTFQMAADPVQTWNDIKVFVGDAANDNQRQLMTTALQAKLAEHYDIIYRDAVMADGHKAAFTFGRVGGYFQFDAVLGAGVVRATKMAKGTALIRRQRALVKYTTRATIRSMGRMVKPAQAMTQFGLKSIAARGLKVTGKWTLKSKTAPVFAFEALKTSTARILRYNPATKEFVVSTVNRSQVPLGTKNGARCYYARITFVVDKAKKQLRITGIELMEHLPKCFVAGTPILMADGTHRAIEQIKAGDLVMSRHEATGATSAQKVTQTFENQVNATLVLGFKNGETIETTKMHPFYVESQGFTPAGEMGIGTAIVTRAGPSAILASSQVRNQSATVYNFEVEKTHTYFVGHSDLWVHNACRFAASFVKHLTKGDGFAFGNQISGCHNLEEFLKFTSANGVKIVSQYDLPVRGLVQVRYEGFVIKNGVRVVKEWSKTLYNPKWISDGKMIGFIKEAYEDSVANGLKQSLNNGSERWWGFVEIDGKQVYFQGYVQIENDVQVIKTGFPRY